MASILSAEEPRTEREYPIPGHGLFKLNVPSSWLDNLHQPPNDLPPTITFTPSSGTSFKILITVLWSPLDKADYNNMQNIKVLMQQRGEELLSTAVESELTLQEMHGKHVAGYFFSLTDKAPKAGEYKYVTQGALGLGKLLLSFTILTNKKDSEVVNEALAMLHNAKQHAPTSQAVVKHAMKCWKCGKQFQSSETEQSGKCPHCGASWKIAPAKPREDEVVKKCRCSMVNFQLQVILASAAGFDLKERIDSYDLYKFSLDNFHITAKKQKDGLEIRLTGDDLEKGATLLDILIKNAEDMQAVIPTVR